MKTLFGCILSLVLLFHHSAQAADDSIYYEIQEDVVTNYINTDKTLGFIRTHVTLMLNDARWTPVIEHNLPLIRDTLIDILGQQSLRKIKSVKGREEIRIACEQAVNQYLAENIGEPPIRQLLFTKYIYQ